VESWLQRCPPAPDHLTPVTHTVEIQVSDETLAALQCDPRSYAAELRVAAAAKHVVAEARRDTSPSHAHP